MPKFDLTRFQASDLDDLRAAIREELTIKGLRVCSRCNTSKPLDQFYHGPHFTDCISTACRKCYIKPRTFTPEQRAAAKEKRLAKAEETRVRRREIYAKLTPEQKEAKLAYAREYGRKYRDEHRENIREQQKAQREGNREEIAAKQRAWRAARKESQNK